MNGNGETMRGGAGGAGSVEGSGTREDMRARADELTRNARQELEDFIGDVEELVKRVGGIDDEDIARVRARIEESLSHAQESLRQSATRADDYIRRSPWTAIGVVAGVGVLLGLLLNRR